MSGAAIAVRRRAAIAATAAPVGPSSGLGEAAEVEVPLRRDVAGEGGLGEDGEIDVLQPLLEPPKGAGDVAPDLRHLKRADPHAPIVDYDA